MYLSERGTVQGATEDRLVRSIADSVAASSDQPAGRVLHTGGQRYSGLCEGGEGARK